MVNSAIPHFKLPLKKPWNFGEVTIVTIDKDIVQRLGINELDTVLEQEITKEGCILMRVRKLKMDLDHK